MNLIQIAWRSLRQRSLSSTLTGLSMALGVALVVIVLVILSTVEDNFNDNANNWHLIIGAKGGKLQLVLNTVYHLSAPVENIPYRVYKKEEENLRANKAFANVDVIPVCLGDNYEGFRVMGTIPRILEIPYSRAGEFEFAQGRNFVDEAGLFEAVLGATAAKETGLKLGDQLRPTHGIATDAANPDVHDAFEIVGILEPTGTPNDRVVFINMEGFYLQDKHALTEDLVEKIDAVQPQTGYRDEARDDGHEDEAEDEEHADEDHEGDEHEEEHADDDHEHDHEPLPDHLREVTAVLIRFDQDRLQEARYSQFATRYSMLLQERLNLGVNAQAVNPLTQINMLLNTFVTPFRQLLMFLAVLIVIVAGIGIMVGIYNTMNDRRRDIAVMRALGAGRGVVMTIILAESLLLALGGGLVGFVGGHVATGFLSQVFSDTTGVVIPFWFVTWQEIVLLPGLVVLATLAGLWPALAAYRTDVSKSLTATP